ncbi:MAG: D-alanyl-D-alanine carboxypeptidase/D-alanyl-D-alanine-endopeptidase [candidate division KSB1 bacterium]|nr:D-alanyl-D-alanine carboxypeptidase/D-alanyl-D-alanine-endopeptidase [candidate division KSB1 bacterium]MDZ7302898.1 D-alanyl-D-alanine carboxypeptidase/D-alanyl-D-alanine-endopeptidase [candidate division KSB1 bacterium]MDZ7310473.1 D-alanyl-D-alanine carboxypeptidase/D-alanyl-D-alanine-endopeptidase [candidate division KSB1 bacterium]
MVKKADHFLRIPVFLATCLALACATTTKMKMPSRGAQSLVELRQRIDRILADSALVHSITGVKIVSLRTGETLYERNADLLAHPASNQKLLTSAAALSLLGPAYVFRTIVACDTTAQMDSVLQGDLYLIGRGNPDLRNEDLVGLALKLAQIGLREIRGNLVCDDFYFDDVRWGSGWMWDDDPAYYAPRISALTVNDNIVVVRVTPAKEIAKPASVQIDPSNDHVTLVNTSVTVKRRAQIDSLGLPHLNITRKWQEHENTILVEGAIAQDESPQEEELNVLEPEIYCGRLFRDALQHAGITVRGTVQRGLAPAKTKILAEHRAPIMPVLINLNKISDNLTAELFLKTIGAEKLGRPGTWAKGVRVTRQFLASVGVDTSAVYNVDGSGLSHLNLITPANIVNLLVAMWKNFAVRNEFAASLPIAGVDGTLRRRMKGTPAEGVLHAKTGTISAVSTLSGYTTTADGEELAFSMMMQHFLAGSTLIRSIQDRIGVELCAFRRGPVAGQ